LIESVDETGLVNTGNTETRLRNWFLLRTGVTFLGHVVYTI
jgi:hypothetical protein